MTLTSLPIISGLLSQFLVRPALTLLLLVYVHVKVSYTSKMKENLNHQQTPESSTQTYSISELSKAFEITPRSIRYYESEGLISPQRIGSQRIYYRGDWIRLQLILRGKRVGFSLSEIREIINLYDSPSGEEKQATLLVGKIEERRHALFQQQKDIKTMLSELDQLEVRITQQEK